MAGRRPGRLWARGQMASHDIWPKRFLEFPLALRAESCLAGTWLFLVKIDIISQAGLSSGSHPLTPHSNFMWSWSPGVWSRLG